MEEVIDAIADAVSQLILFSLEAETNKSKLTNLGPGAKAVRECVDAMLTVVESMGTQFRDQPEIQNKMLEGANFIRNSTHALERHANVLMKDEMNKDAKKGLLEAAKDLLQGTIKELHLTDKYQVNRIVRACQNCKSKVDETNHLNSAEGLSDAARGMAASVVEVCKHVNERIKVLADPSMKGRLNDANSNLKAGAPKIIHALGDAMQDPTDPGRRVNQSRVGAELKRTLDEIIRVSEESNRTMFDGLDLDFDIRSTGSEALLKNYREAPEMLLKALKMLSDAVDDGDALGVAQALQMISDAIEAAKLLAENTKDPALRERMLRAIADLERIRDQLLPLAKAALAGDAAARQRLKELIAEAERRAREIAEAALWDELWDTMKQTDAALDRLIDAIERGDLEGAKREKELIERLLNKEIELLGKLGENVNDPKWKDRIDRIRGRLQDLDKAFKTTSSAALRDPKNADTKARLKNVAEEIKAVHRELGNAFPGVGGADYIRFRDEYDRERAEAAERARRAAAEAAAARAAASARPAVGNAEILEAARKIEEQLPDQDDETTPEGRLYAAMRRVAEEMKLLAAAAERGDKAEVIKIARRIQGHVKDIGTNANQVAAKTTDKRLAQSVLQYAGQVQTIAVQLKVITAVKATTSANDPTIKAQLVKCAKSLSNNLVDTCRAVGSASIRFQK